jgi:hypothetical protein
LYGKAEKKAVGTTRDRTLFEISIKGETIGKRV